MKLNLTLKGPVESLVFNLTESLNISPEEIILDSLALYEAAITEREGGGKIWVDNKKGELTEITTATLSKVFPEYDDIGK